MINRQDIIRKAIDECYNEMYKWAQPSINLEEYIKNPELRKESENDKFYTRYYLSQENMKYIVEGFIQAYHIGRDWNDNIDLLINYITSDKSVRDKYIPGENGFPGYSGYEPIVPLQDITEDSEKVLNLINTCREFYKRDFESESFNLAIYLGASPYSNKEKVEEYWRNHGRPDFTIKEFNIEDIEYPEDEDSPTEEEFIETLK